MDGKYIKAVETLKKYKQGHIIDFIEKSDKKVQKELIKQVLRIDFDELEELYNQTFDELYVDLEELKPVSGINPDKLNREELEKYEKIGVEIIKNNKFAVATMAGGQSTRLRPNKVKGNI